MNLFKEELVPIELSNYDGMIVSKRGVTEKGGYDYISLMNVEHIADVLSERVRNKRRRELLFKLNVRDKHYTGNEIPVHE